MAMLWISWILALMLLVVPAWTVEAPPEAFVQQTYPGTPGTETKDDLPDEPDEPDTRASIHIGEEMPENLYAIGGELLYQMGGTPMTIVWSAGLEKGEGSALPEMLAHLWVYSETEGVEVSNIACDYAPPSPDTPLAKLTISFTVTHGDQSTNQSETFELYAEGEAIRVVRLL